MINSKVVEGISNDFEYVVINEYQCTCATDICSDFQEIILSNEEDISPSKCSLSSSKTMIGNVTNNAAALYNIQFERQYHSSKLAPSTCRVYEHELFYSLYGIDKFPLQSTYFCILGEKHHAEIFAFEVLHRSCPGVALCCDP